MVAIAILSLLMSVLLPSLKGAREHAKQLRCSTNQRQLMTASLVYASEFKDYPPMPNWGAQDPATGWLYNPPMVPVHEHHRTGLIWPFQQVDEVYRCPMHEEPYTGSANMTSYLMNGAVAGYGRGDVAFTTSRFRAEALIIWEAEETGWNDGSSYPFEGLTKRHGKGASVTGIDGHAEFMSREEFDREAYRAGRGRLWCAPDTEDGH